VRPTIEERVIARTAADRVQHRTSQPRIFMNGQMKIAAGQPIRAKWGRKDPGVTMPKQKKC
jgi:hypothetical protein